MTARLRRPNTLTYRLLNRRLEWSTQSWLPWSRWTAIGPSATLHKLLCRRRTYSRNVHSSHRCRQSTGLRIRGVRPACGHRRTLDGRVSKQPTVWPTMLC
jgi:hypothetical protein